jgi:hypothetical protein
LVFAIHPLCLFFFRHCAERVREKIYLNRFCLTEGMGEAESSEENLPERDSIHGNSFQSYPASLLLLFNSSTTARQRRQWVFLFVCDFERSDSVGRDFILSERSKKDRLRRLSAVGWTSSSYEGYEMGCDVSDREDELRVQAPSMSNGSSKRFKISKKVESFDEWKFLNIVHAP